MQARVNRSDRAVCVSLSVRWLLVVSLVTLVALPMAGWAQTEPNPPVRLDPAPAPGGAGTAEVSGSFVAEAIGNDVYIRSGPGTNFYHCGKLYASDRVQVSKSQDGWSCIVPPPGSFSWIAAQYVSINLQDPTKGIVTGDNVGVYAGSDFVLPMHSTSKQVSLNRGQIVKLLGEEKDNYYKIVPPQGAYLWVSTQFLQPAGAPLGRPPIVDVGAMAKAIPTVTPSADANAAPLSGLDLYYALSEQVKAEHEKPIAEQSYAEIKKKLAELSANKDGGRAARFAEYTLKQVERYELVGTVSKELELQNKELQKVTAKIDEARATKLAQVVDTSKFALVGKLENSSVYGTAGPMKRFRMLDDSGKTVCYVMPTGAAAGMDLSKFVGHKVGLVGKIEPHEATARALIQFNEIVQLD
jgi:uncharacterized protein YgiM (DUF1202 family)